MIGETSSPMLSAALDYLRSGLHPIPLCWPVDGACGCGRGHQGKDTGKAPLLGEGYQDRPITETKVLG
jgi:hypothetical protein